MKLFSFLKTHCHSFDDVCRFAYVALFCSGFLAAACGASMSAKELKAARDICLELDPGTNADPNVQLFCENVEAAYGEADAGAPADQGAAGAGGNGP